MVLVELAACEVEDLSDSIVQLHALQTAATAHMLRLIAEYDRRQAWVEDGCCSMADWLVGRLGVSRKTANDLVKVAGRLAEQPDMARAMAAGELSLDQVRAATQVSIDPAEAAGCSVARLEASVRQQRRVTRQDDVERQRRRSVRWWWDHDAGMLNLRGRLADADGQRVVKALERLANEAPPDPASGSYEPFECRCADALAILAGQSLAGNRDVDRATLVIHVDADSGDGELESGVRVSFTTVDLWSCDARVQWVFDGTDGKPVGIGRVSREIPSWLERLVRKRDKHCQFPGCDRTRWLQVHHVVHWTDGGPTDLDNLTLLCTHHHRWLHRRDGRIPRRKQPRLRPQVQQRMLGDFPIVA